MVTDTRRLPYASIRLYDAGQGDPVVTDHGFGWYDLLIPDSNRPGPFGASNRDARGFPFLELLPEVGLVCRPFSVPQHTRADQYLFSGGEWDEDRPGTEAPRVSRLSQNDTTPGVIYSATSKFNLPKNPSVIFTFELPDTPADWDAETLPPFVQVEFGQGKWAIYFGKSGGHLLRKVNGVWAVEVDLPAPPQTVYEERQDVTRVWVRCLRGKIGVSTDDGRSYVWGENADKSAITVPGSPLTLTGQGGAVTFGLWQIVYFTGVYTSATRNTFRSRVSAVPTFTPRKLEPTGTEVTFADLSSPPLGMAQYAATLTPKATPGSPFTFYHTPELHAVTFSYPVVATPGSGDYTTPWDNYLLGLEVTQPYELAAGCCRFWAEVPFDAEPLGGCRWRRVEVLAGFTQADDAPDVSTQFVGYISSPDPKRPDFGRVRLDLRAENASIRFRRAKWNVLDCIPLGDRTLNAALDHVLASEGLNGSYRSWHAWGDVLLPAGTPEDPFELLQPDECKWETLVRLAGYRGLEIGITKDGTFVTVPRQFVSATTHTYSCTGDTLLTGIGDLTNPTDHSESVTAVLVTGKAENGSALLAWAVDAEAEGVTSSERFSPWRETRQEQVSGVCDPGILVSRAQALAYEGFAQKIEPELSVPLTLDVSRRDRVIVNGGAGQGIPDGTAHVVLTLKWEMESAGDLARLRTVAGLRRL